LGTTADNYSREIRQTARIRTSAAEREMTIGAAEKESAEGVS